MQSSYPERFERDMACTESDWLRWLPGAIGELNWALQPGAADVRIGDGTLGLQWQGAEPRALGLVRLPCLLVNFCFADVDEPQRDAFMKRFDLYMQRGGG